MTFDLQSQMFTALCKMDHRGEKSKGEQNNLYDYPVHVPSLHLCSSIIFYKQSK